MRRTGTLLAGALLLGCTTTPRGGGGTPENTDWRLVELAGQHARVMDAAAPTLRLDASDGRASGNTGCNGFSGGYTLRGDSVTFGPLASTRRACVDEGMNRQESAYMGLLSDARSWRVEGDTLVIVGAAGTEARLVRT